LRRQKQEDGMGKVDQNHKTCRFVYICFCKTERGSQSAKVNVDNFIKEGCNMPGVLGRHLVHKDRKPLICLAVAGFEKL